MTIDQLRDFFMWMTIINFGIFIFSVILSMLLKGVIARMHSKFFGIKEEQVSAIVYSFFAVYKIGIILFNLVPFVALLLVS